MKTIIITLCLCYSSTAYGQIFTNASTNLPNNGAKGQSMDVVAVDVDGDKDLDIVLANEFQANTILINDGKGNFKNGTAGKLPQIIRDSEDIAYADFNGDGFVDLVFCSEDDIVMGKTKVHEYYLGDGKGGFTSAPFILPDSEANAIATADINRDGFPDIILGNKGKNTVLINDGKGNFAIENNRLPSDEKTTQDLAFVDVNGDGILDLFEGNEDGNELYIGNEQGYFTKVTETHLPKDFDIETRKICFADIDRDKDMDIFLANVEFKPGKDPQNRLLINNGNGIFTDKTAAQLPADEDHTIDAIFEDVDGDKDMDLLLANVFGAHIKCYFNDGNGNFTDNTLDVFEEYYVRDALGIIAADFNGDGLRDLYICDRYNPNKVQKDLLLINAGTTKVASFDDKPNDYKLFPHPVGNTFSVNIDTEDIESISLINQCGEYISPVNYVVREQGVVDCLIENENLANGVYYVKIGQKKSLLTTPIIIQK
ncbi:MAG TPA: VCBS repeat-containing protein [Candidatus Kapabacteria bacterium]|nr:VCBS repeat-containing protein [Ignavibacteria bacterium]HRK58220.1 VCBS repeat-containing protein [Candidatus Kapabacteria bacterium]